MRLAICRECEHCQIGYISTKHGGQLTVRYCDASYEVIDPDALRDEEACEYSEKKS